MGGCAACQETEALGKVTMSGSIDYTGRFLGKAEAYSKNRPRYPQAIVDTLEKVAGFDKEKVVADIGSGTGILSQLFLEYGNLVYCVEPNRDMRKVEEENLARYAPRFVSVAGRADDTKLPDHSIDLVTAGQALHWFGEGARKEFTRIARSDGYVAIVYNHRKELSPADKMYGTIVDKHSKDRASVPDADDGYIMKFFFDQAKKFVFPNSQVLDEEGMLGRIASASYMPSPGSNGYDEVVEDVRTMFEEFGAGGSVTLNYDTVMHLGRVSP